MQNHEIEWIVGSLVLAGLAVYRLRNRRRLHAIEVTTSHPLCCTTARAYSELQDLGNWWQWDCEACASSITTGNPGMGQVLFTGTGGAVQAKEVIQAWKDKRLQLVGQSLAEGYTRWDQFDLNAEGAHCWLRWHTRLESATHRHLAANQLRLLKRNRLLLVTKLNQHLISNHQ